MEELNGYYSEGSCQVYKGEWISSFVVVRAKKSLYRNARTRLSSVDNTSGLMTSSIHRLSGTALPPDGGTSCQPLEDLPISQKPAVYPDKQFFCPRDSSIYMIQIALATQNFPSYRDSEMSYHQKVEVELPAKRQSGMQTPSIKNRGEGQWAGGYPVSPALSSGDAASHRVTGFAL